MTLNTIFDEKNCTIFIEGSIDTLTARELEQAVNEAAPKCEKMVLDMEKVDYISSGGLRVLLAIEQQMEDRGGGLRLIHVNENIIEIFELVGFMDVVTVDQN